MKSKIAFITSLVALLAATFGTVGFSVLELEQRSSTVDVSAEDPKGLLALQPGNASVVTTNSDGVLEINLGDDLGQDEGVNPKSRLEIGNGNADGNPGFTATNSFNKDVKVNLNVNNIQQPKDPSNNSVGKILVYQDGTEYNVTAGDTIPEITLTSGSSASYSIHFDTPRNIGTADAYSADLTFQVTEA